MTAVTAIDDQQMADATAAFFGQATGDGLLSERLQTADTVAQLHFSDQAGVTLWLDRDPPAAEAQIVGQAEVQLWGSAERFLAVARGRDQLAMAIMRGEIEYTGPVRKLLRVMPILRSFDTSVWGHDQLGA